MQHSFKDILVKAVLTVSNPLCTIKGVNQPSCLSATSTQPSQEIVYKKNTMYKPSNRKLQHKWWGTKTACLQERHTAEDNDLTELSTSHPQRLREEICKINNSICERMKKQCTFKSIPLDTAVTAPGELAQLKVVIALVISPINFSHCTKEQEHNGQSDLTLHRLNSFPCHTPGVCMVSLHVPHPFHPFYTHSAFF